MDILSIEKEAVYRRLNQKVPFSFREIAIISKYMGISLDNLIGLDPQKNRPLQLKVPDFFNPKESDQLLFDQLEAFLKMINEAGKVEMGLVANLLPQNIYSGFPYLLKFKIFVWLHHYDNNRTIPFHLINVPDNVLNLYKILFVEFKKFSTNYFVFDSQIFRNLIDIISYFSKISMIRREDVLKIKAELFRVLDYMENMAITGKFEETGHKVSLYITNISMPNGYSYIETQTVRYSMIKAFYLSFAASFDNQIFYATKNWMRSIIKVSTLISETAEKYRVFYFENQRKIVSEL